MKKAKVMLASLAVVAVIGGSLAFKAAKLQVRNLNYKATADLSLVTINAVYPKLDGAQIPSSAIPEDYYPTFYYDNGTVAPAAYEPSGL